MNLLTVVGLAGSPCTPSRTRAIVKTVMDRIAAQAGAKARLVDVADLAPVFAAAAAALEPTGLFAFTVQTCADDATPAGYMLGSDNRFAHSAAHIGAGAAAQGFALRHFELAAARQDSGSDVPGAVVVLEARAG